MSNTGLAYGADLWGSGLEGTAALANAARGSLPGEIASTADLATLAPLALVVLAVGLALWLVGDRLFRPASSLIGAGLGALLGLMATGAIQNETLGGVPTIYAAIGLGSLLGLGIGAAMYRIAVGAAAALTLGGLAAVLAATISLHEPGTSWFDGASRGVPERPETIAEVASARAARVAIERVSFDGLFEGTQAAGESSTIEGLQGAAATAGALARAEWAALPDQTHMLVTAAAILGCVVGLAIGLFRPRAAGPAVAALAGSALWLGATTVLLARSGQPVPPMPTQQPGAWLAAWLLVALVGFAVQRKVIRPAALVTGDE